MYFLRFNADPAFFLKKCEFSDFGNVSLGPVSGLVIIANGIRYITFYILWYF
jgi:hypothetical protein